MNDPVLETRLDRAEKDIEDQRKRVHGVSGTIATLATTVTELKVELKELRSDQEEQARATNERLQTISRWFMFAGTSFLGLAGLVIGLVTKGG